MKQVIFNRWNFTRFLRLVLGIVIIVQSIMTGNQAMGIAGILFVAIPLFNIGCCATGSCSLSPEKTPALTKEITYEEVL